MAAKSDRQGFDAGGAKLREAVRLHQAGDLGRAEALYREAVAAAPDDADALHLLGVLSHQKGQSALGVGHIERALLAGGQNSPNAPPMPTAVKWVNNKGRWPYPSIVAWLAPSAAARA